MDNHVDQPSPAPAKYPRRVLPASRPAGTPPVPSAMDVPRTPLARDDQQSPTVIAQPLRGVSQASPNRPSPAVVQGAASKSQYIRVMTTEAHGGFRRRPSGMLEATVASSRAHTGVAGLWGRCKALLVGSPLSTARLVHERLSKLKALAVFSSDALSSSAYATEEILLVLSLAGAGALRWSIPIAAGIAVLLLIVVISYRQTIRAYPNGGGAYIVARKNLGQHAGLVAAAALLIDYILTVSVSVAAGVAAITSAVPEVSDHRVLIGSAVIAVVTLINLRGVRESGRIFAIPTYAFIAMAFALLGVGAVRVATGSISPVPPDQAMVATRGLGLFLILRAFSSGCAALTGVEAISNGVPAFQTPEAKNASNTLVWMGVILGTLFLGITLLAHRLAIFPNDTETVVSQLGRAVFGENALYFGWQAATALILLLAANTSYADFPRLGSLLAKDNYMPHQFTFRGDRLAFSNGILVLGAAAVAILALYRGEVTRLIPLYAVGVFVSFTLSQAGMVRHWQRYPERGSGRRKAINALGAGVTGLVALVIVLTKFTHGAWLSILVGAVLVLLFRAIHHHYTAVDAELALPTLDHPLPIALPPRIVVVPVRALNRPVIRALAYARSIAPTVQAVHVTDDPAGAEQLRGQWDRWAGDVPLVLIESPYRSFTEPLLHYIDNIEDGEPDPVVTVVLPEYLPRHWWQTLLHNQDALRLKTALLFRKGTVVIDVPQHAGATEPIKQSAALPASTNLPPARETDTPPPAR